MVVTLGEVLKPLAASSQKDKVAAALYFLEQIESTDLLRVSELRTALQRAGVKNAKRTNWNAVLGGAPDLFWSPGEHEGTKYWKLTETGKSHAQVLLGIADASLELVRDAQELRHLVDQVPEAGVRTIVEETIVCVRANALRAATVLAWVAAIRLLQQAMLTFKGDALDNALQRHEPRVRDIKTIDDFAYVKESKQLLAAQELGILDKGERQVLGQCLDLRNKCGHPGKYAPGPRRVSALLEDLTSIVFSRA